jgi:hypothetical protein
MVIYFKRDQLCGVLKLTSQQWRLYVARQSRGIMSFGTAIRHSINDNTNGRPCIRLDLAVSRSRGLEVDVILIVILRESEGRRRVVF